MLEKNRFEEINKKYANSKNVVLCDSMPSIELWFLLHYINITRYYGTSKAVIKELEKYVACFAKTGEYLEKPQWVEDLCKDGKLLKAITRAKNNGVQNESYSNLWMAMTELGIG